MVNLYIRYGRPFAFVILTILQGFLIARFLRKCHKSSGWYAIAVLFLPAAVAWRWETSDLTGRLRWSFVTWSLHVGMGLVPAVGLIIRLAESKLQTEATCSLDGLKLVLCISALLVLVLLSKLNEDPGSDTLFLGEYRALITNLSYKMTTDLFDGVDLLGVIFQENEVSHGIPLSYETGLIISACIGFLLSPLELFDYKVDDERGVTSRVAVGVFRILTQAGINALFLGLRLGIHLKYTADASIFIAKNVIMILVAFFKLVSFLQCCEGEHDIEV